MERFLNRKLGWSGGEVASGFDVVEDIGLCVWRAFFVVVL